MRFMFIGTPDPVLELLVGGILTFPPPSPPFVGKKFTFYLSNMFFPQSFSSCFSRLWHGVVPFAESVFFPGPPFSTLVPVWLLFVSVRSPYCRDPQRSFPHSDGHLTTFLVVWIYSLLIGTFPPTDPAYTHGALASVRRCFDCCTWNAGPRLLPGSG